MKFAIIISLCLLILGENVAFSQKLTTKSTINEAETALLDILSKDTINPLQIKLDGDIFKFGLQVLVNSNISLLKNKKDIHIQPLGTGKLYQVKKEQKGGLQKNTYQLIRIDSTIFFGANFHAITFFMNDTLFQYGGDGFWHVRGIVTYFSKKTHEWELYNSSRMVVALDDEKYNIVYHIDKNNNRIYLSNAFTQLDFPNIYNLKRIDSVYEFNTHSHQWTTLGQTNPKLNTIIEGVGTSHYQINNYSIIQNQLELRWADFRSNTFGKFDKKSNNEFKETWLSIYLNNTKYHSLQFCLGNTLYLTKVDELGKLSFKTFDINKSQFELSNQYPIYLPTNPLLQLISHHIIDISLYVIVGLITIAIVIYWLKRRKTKNVLNKEISHILNNHFFESLTVIEKELIEVLYEHHLKGSLISTKLINKIIGVQNKDVMTQNKNRSDYFLKINQKFKFATHKELPLIIKTRDELDKRQFNYGLQEVYMSELAILIRK
jgi:hypothetical protein